jgi:hypothetical protein
MHQRGQKKYLERESFGTYSDMSLKMKISEQFDLSLKGDTSRAIPQGRYLCDAGHQDPPDGADEHAQAGGIGPVLPGGATEVLATDGI